MSLTIVTPPVSLAERVFYSVVSHLNADVETGESHYFPDADYILTLTEAAVALLDGPGGTIGRCLLEQTWRLSIDHCFPPIIGLTLPPIRSVESVKYYDSDGALQTLSPSRYRVTGTGWLTEIAPAYGDLWPSVRWQRETIQVDFVAGYGASVDDVPAPILQAIRMIVGHWWANRETVIVGSSSAEIPFGAKQLLAQYRVFRCPVA